MIDPIIDQSAIEAAARVLEEGGLVAFPTETVYGLGADAENPRAVAAIYAAKGRPANHPVIVHLAPGADLGRWAKAVPEAARKLIDAFWPGPLTLILERAEHIPDCVSGGQASIGLRCPSHPVAQALIHAFKGGKGGVAAPSANRFGHVSPTTAQHVRDEFGGDPLVQTILDGGQSQVGIESTIIDLSRIASHGPVLLRPGQIGLEQIAGVLGSVPSHADATAPRASGTLEAHYAPRTPLALVKPAELAAVMDRLHAAGRRVALIDCASDHNPGQISRSGGGPIARHAMPKDARGYAHDLYAALRGMDGAGADLILVSSPPAGDEWQGVNDRLRRAAFDSAGILERLADGT